MAQDKAIDHVILQCRAINDIDLSALESLEEIMHRLSEMKVQLHLSEVKGPVMDRLERGDFLDQLTGRVFLSQHEAMMALTPRPDPQEPQKPNTRPLQIVGGTEP